MSDATIRPGIYQVEQRYRPEGAATWTRRLKVSADGRVYGLRRKTSGAWTRTPVTKVIATVDFRTGEINPAGGKSSDATLMEAFMNRTTIEAHCTSCGRKLTDPKSATLGIGPECITKAANA